VKFWEVNENSQALTLFCLFLQGTEQQFTNIQASLFVTSMNKLSCNLLYKKLILIHVIVCNMCWSTWSAVVDVIYMTMLR